MKKNKPIRVLWHGNVKANIWVNPTETGEMYSVNYARICTDKHGDPQEAYSFSDVENLRLEALAREANTVCNELRREYNARSRAHVASDEPAPRSRTRRSAQRPSQPDNGYDDTPTPSR